MAKGHFGRKWHIRISTPTISASTVTLTTPDGYSYASIDPVAYYDIYNIEDLDFEAKIVYNLSDKANESSSQNSLTLYGLGGSKILDRIKEGSKVEIRAGYETESGNISSADGATLPQLDLLYSGEVNTYEVANNAGDSSLRISLKANSLAVAASRISQMFPKGTSLQDVVDSLSYLFNQPVVLSETLKSVVLKEDENFYGNAMQELEDFLNKYKYSITSQQDMYYVISITNKDAKEYSLYDTYAPKTTQVLAGIAYRGRNSDGSRESSKEKNISMKILLQHVALKTSFTLSPDFGGFQGTYIPEEIAYDLNSRGTQWYTVLNLKQRPDTVGV
jgi:hypothetical protein